MPSIEAFESQDEEYKAYILPDVYTISIEAGSTLGWYKYADDVIGIDTFGASGPANELFEAFGFTIENIKALFNK